MLGWSNQRKLDALLAQATSLTAQLSTVAAEQKEHERALGAVIERGHALTGLDQTHEFAEIDWPSIVNRAEQLRDEKSKLEATSRELARLNGELEEVKAKTRQANAALSEVDGQLGGLDTREQAAEAVLGESRATLAEAACAAGPGAVPRDQGPPGQGREARARHRRGLRPGRNGRGSEITSLAPEAQRPAVPAG